MSDWRIINTDVIDGLQSLDEQSIQCVVTSPPYWGLRDYGVDGQLGLERTPEEYVDRMVGVFREVRRVLRDDGTVWLNLGDSYYNTNPGGGGPGDKSGLRKDGRDEESRIRSARISLSHQRFNTIPDIETIVDEGKQNKRVGRKQDDSDAQKSRQESLRESKLKPKDLVGIPWRVAFALQSDGWYLRSDIIWSKPNPMPESVTDRPTKAHEYLFLLTKSARYFYDADAIQEEAVVDSGRVTTVGSIKQQGTKRNDVGLQNIDSGTRNKRSVWEIATQPFPEAHFAVMPTKLVEPCVLAGSAKKDIVLDPFCGSGTVGVVALRYGRRFIGIDLSEEYCEMAKQRIDGDCPLFNREAQDE